MIKIKINPQKYISPIVWCLAKSLVSLSIFMFMYFRTSNIFSRLEEWLNKKCFPLLRGSKWLYYAQPSWGDPFPTQFVPPWPRLFSWRVSTDLKPMPGSQWPVKTAEPAFPPTALSSQVLTQEAQMQDSQRESWRVLGSLENERMVSLQAPEEGTALFAAEVASRS